MSFNIKRHISTSVISWWLGHTCYLDSVKSEFLDRCERHGSRPISENVNFHTCWSGNWTCPIPKKKRICTSVVVDVGTCPDFRKSELAGLLLVCWGGNWTCPKFGKNKFPCPSGGNGAHPHLRKMNSHICSRVELTVSGSPKKRIATSLGLEIDHVRNSEKVNFQICAGETITCLSVSVCVYTYIYMYEIHIYLYM